MEALDIIIKVLIAIILLDVLLFGTRIASVYFWDWKRERGYGKMFDKDGDIEIYERELARRKQNYKDSAEVSDELE
jgi:hypothetical protein